MIMAFKLDRVVTWNKENFTWSSYKDPETLEKSRISGIEIFLSDYEKEKKEGRYIPDKVPALPFRDSSFDLAISSYLLLLYSSLGYEFHVAPGNPI